MTISTYRQCVDTRTMKLLPEEHLLISLPEICRGFKSPGFIPGTWKAFYYLQEILNKVQTCVAFIFPCAAWLHVSLSSTSLLDLVVQQARQRGPIASLPPLMKNQPTNHLSTTLIYLVSGGLLSVYYFC